MRSSESNFKKRGPEVGHYRVACLLLAGFALSNQRNSFKRVEGSTMTEADIATAPNPEKAKAAFNEAAKVFFSARCANCHPAATFRLRATK